MAVQEGYRNSDYNIAFKRPNIKISPRCHCSIRSSDGKHVIVEEKYENERWTFKWNPEGAPRGNWSDVTGHIDRSEIILSPKWVWDENTKWKEDFNVYGSCDKDGWSYAKGWDSEDWHPTPRKVIDRVRMRKWIRPRVYMGPSGECMLRHKDESSELKLKRGSIEIRNDMIAIVTYKTKYAILDPDDFALYIYGRDPRLLKEPPKLGDITFIPMAYVESIAMWSEKGHRHGILLEYYDEEGDFRSIHLHFSTEVKHQEWIEAFKEFKAVADSLIDEADLLESGASESDTEPPQSEILTDPQLPKQKKVPSDHEKSRRKPKKRRKKGKRPKKRRKASKSIISIAAPSKVRSQIDPSLQAIRDQTHEAVEDVVLQSQHEKDEIVKSDKTEPPELAEKHTNPPQPPLHQEPSQYDPQARTPPQTSRQIVEQTPQIISQPSDDPSPQQTDPTPSSTPDTVSNISSTVSPPAPTPQLSTSSLGTSRLIIDTSEPTPEPVTDSEPSSPERLSSTPPEIPHHDLNSHSHEIVQKPILEMSPTSLNSRKTSTASITNDGEAGATFVVHELTNEEISHRDIEERISHKNSLTQMDSFPIVDTREPKSIQPKIISLKDELELTDEGIKVFGKTLIVGNAGIDAEDEESEEDEFELRSALRPLETLELSVRKGSMAVNEHDNHFGGEQCEVEEEYSEYETETETETDEDDEEIEKREAEQRRQEKMFDFERDQLRAQKEKYKKEREFRKQEQERKRLEAIELEKERLLEEERKAEERKNDRVRLEKERKKAIEEERKRQEVNWLRSKLEEEKEPDADPEDDIGEELRAFSFKRTTDSESSDSGGSFGRDEGQPIIDSSSSHSRAIKTYAYEPMDDPIQPPVTTCGTVSSIMMTFEEGRGDNWKAVGVNSSSMYKHYHGNNANFKERIGQAEFGPEIEFVDASYMHRGKRDPDDYTNTSSCRTCSIM